jgi:hypothetical protein
MQQAIINSRENVTLLLLVVPTGTFDIELYKSGNSKKVRYTYSRGNITYCEQKQLKDLTKYKDNFMAPALSSNKKIQIIGLASTITEKQAKELVDDIIGYYKDYSDLEFDVYVMDTAKESLQSLIQSSGLTIGENQDVLILKNEKSN